MPQSLTAMRVFLNFKKGVYMPSAEKQSVELACPGCKKKMKVKFIKIIEDLEAKCHKCGSKYLFKAKAVSSLKVSLRNLDSAEEKVGKILETAIESAETILNKKK